MRPRLRRIWAVIALVVLALAVLGWAKRDWVMARAYLLTLESEWRLEQLQIDRVMETLALGPGMKIADIGAGTGVFSRPFATRVGTTGVIYAVDINTELLRHIERTAKKQGLANLHTIIAAEDDPLIPAPVDVIFICDSLHHIGGRNEYVKTLRRYLNPGGRLAIIDFDGGFPHIDPDMRFSLDELEAWTTNAGFVLESTHSFIPGNFFHIYSCAGCPGTAPSTTPPTRN